MRKNYTYSSDPYMNFKFLIEDGVLKTAYLSGRLKYKTVIIPDGVVRLGKSAFSNCDSWWLERIVIPKSVETIESGAFYDFKGEFEIKEGCTAACYENGILYSGDRTRLLKATKTVVGTEVVIPKGVLEIGDRAFRQLRISSVTLPEGLLLIGKNAFEDCMFADVRLPESLQKIDSEAFCLNKLSKIVIPKAVKAINRGALEHNDFEAFEVDAENPYFKSIDGVLFTKSGKKLLQCPPKKQGDFVIPKETTKISKGAFSGSKLDELTISASAGETVEIAIYSFSDIKKVVLEEGIQYIDAHAFLNCTNLEEVVLPSTLKTIGFEAFGGCNRLTRVDIPEGVTEIATYSFSGRNIKEIVIPSTVRKIGRGAFPPLHIDPRKTFDHRPSAIERLLIRNNPYAVRYAEENGYPYEEI